MKIVVCLKQVPDTTAVKIDPKTGTLIRDGVFGSIFTTVVSGTCFKQTTIFIIKASSYLNAAPAITIF